MTTTLRLGALRRQVGGTTRMTGPLTMTDRDVLNMQQQGFASVTAVRGVRVTKDDNRAREQS